MHDYKIDICSYCISNLMGKFFPNKDIEIKECTFCREETETQSFTLKFMYDEEFEEMKSKGRIPTDEYNG